MAKTKTKGAAKCCSPKGHALSELTFFLALAFAALSLFFVGLAYISPALAAASL